jgi:hypothetical protein
MKRLIYIPALLLTLLISCKPSPKEAAAFNDRIMSEQKKVVMAYDGLLETYDSYVPRKMDSALIDFENQALESIDNVRAVVPVIEGEALKNAVLEYLEIYKSVAQNEAEELVRLYKVPENEFTPEIRIQWDARYKDVDTRIKEAAKHLKEVQAAFANDFNLVIVK